MINLDNEVKILEALKTLSQYKKQKEEDPKNDTIKEIKEIFDEVAAAYSYEKQLHLEGKQLRREGKKQQDITFLGFNF